MTDGTGLAVHGYAVSQDPASAVDAAMALADVGVADVAVLVSASVERIAVPGWWTSPSHSGLPRLTIAEGQRIAATLADAAVLLRDSACRAVLLVSSHAALLVALPDPQRVAFAQIATGTAADAVATLAAQSGVAVEDVTQLRVPAGIDIAAVVARIGLPAGDERSCVLGQADADEVAALAAAVADLHRAVLPATPEELRDAAGALPEPLCITVSGQPWARRTRDGSRAAVIATETVLHLVSSTRPAGDGLPLDWFGHGGPAMLILHADTGAGLQEAASRAHDELSAGADLVELSRRHAGAADSALRAVLLAADTPAMLAELEAAQRHLAGRIDAAQPWITPSGSFCTPEVIGPDAKVALVYPGTFAMYPGAEAGLCELFPALLAGAERVESRPYHALAIGDSYLRSARSPSADEIAAHAAALNSDVGFTSAAGVYFGLLSTPMVRLLGIAPHGAFGYSLGEICMLWGMDVWENSEEIGRSVRNSPLFTSELYGQRSAVREEWNLPDTEQVWQTLALAAPADRVREAVAEHDRVFVTHVNTANEVVIAGDPAQCEQVAEQIGCPHFPLPGGGPVLHVPIAARARHTILAVTDHPLSPAGAQPELFFASGRSVDLTDRDDIAESVLELCYSDVDFPQLCQRAHDAGFRYFIEVGPGADCTRWISTNLRDRPHIAVSIDQRAMPTAVGIARALAKLISAGLQVDVPYLGEITPEVPVQDAEPSLFVADDEVLQIADHDLAELTAVSAVQAAEVYATASAVTVAATTVTTAPVTQRLPARRAVPAPPAVLGSLGAIAGGVARAHIAALDAQSALQHSAMDALFGTGRSGARPAPEPAPPTLGPWAQILRAVELGTRTDAPVHWNGLHLTWHGRPQEISRTPRVDLTVRDVGPTGAEFAVTGTLDVDGAALVDVDGRGSAGAGKTCPAAPTPVPRSARGARGRGFKPIERTPLTSLTGEQIAALGRGQAPAVYGPRWQQAAGANPGIRIADPAASLLSSIEHVDVRGGPMGLGELRAERVLSAADHASASVLALDAAEQLLRTYAVHLGLHLVFNDAELVPAEAIPLVVSTGAAPAHVDRLVIDAVIVEVTMVPRPTVIADITVHAGGERIATLHGAAVQVRERPGSIFRPELRGGLPVYLGRCNSYGEPVWLNEFHLGHMENGELGVAMGPLFDSYTGKTLLYIPNSEFRLVDRINAVKDADASLRGGRLTIEYDCHPDTWFFEDNSFDGIPASMVMESSLQAAAVTGVCMGTTTIAPPEEKLSVRNLDGSATFLTDLDPRGKTWVQETTLLSTTQVLGQVLQRFKYRITVEDVPYYEGTSLFGYFTDQALASQVGLDSGVEVPRWIDEGDRRATLDVVELDLTDPGLQLHPTLRQGTGYLNLVDHASLVKGGGRHGLGYLAGERRVAPDDWYFQCHFHTDPVMPGSLGVEAVQQGLQIYALAAGLADGPDCTFAVPTGVPFGWTYRGQILRDEPRLSFELDVTDIRETATGLLVLADASVFKPGMRIYHFTGVALEIRGARS